MSKTDEVFVKGWSQSTACLLHCLPSKMRQLPKGCDLEGNRRVRTTHLSCVRRWPGSDWFAAAGAISHLGSDCPFFPSAQWLCNGYFYAPHPEKPPPYKVHRVDVTGALLALV